MTREELYDAVWTTAMHRLSKQYGVSNARLVRICDDHLIPRPDSGFWTRQRLGFEAKRNPLPTATPGIPNTIVIPVKPKSQAKPITESLTRCDVPLSPKSIVKTVLERSSIDLRKVHPLVRSAWKIIMNGIAERGEIMCAPYNQRCIGVRASKRYLGRALLFIDALIRKLEPKGCRIVLSEEGRGCYCFEVDGERVLFWLMEHTQRQKRIPKDEQEAKSFLFQRFSFHSTGRMTFGIKEFEIGWELREWSDAKGSKLEDFIEEIVTAISLAGQRIKQQREEMAACRRAAEVELQKQIDARRRWEEELARRNDLIQQCSHWREADSLRRFVEACRSSLVAAGENNESAEVWLQWATQHAERLDPLKNGWVDKAVKDLPVTNSAKGVY